MRRQPGPATVEAMGPLRLLEFANVILLQSYSSTKLDSVLAFGPGSIVIEDLGGQGLIRMVVRVPAKITVISQVGGAKSRPPVDSKWVRQTELARPVGKVGKCSLIVERSVHAYQEFVQKGIRNQPVVVRRNIVNCCVGSGGSSTVRAGGWIGKDTAFRGVIAHASGISNR